MQPDRIQAQVRRLAAKEATIVNCYRLGIDGTDAEDLGEWKVGDYLGDLAGDLAVELHQCGQYDADEAGGARKYRCVGRDAEGIQVHQWAMRFTAAKTAEGGPTLELDEPSQAGLLAQVMRHQERQFTATMSSQERILRSLHEQLEIRDRRIAQLEKRELEVIEMFRAARLATVDDTSGERTANRIDKAITLITDKVLPAIGIQTGLLPEGFTVDGDPAELKQTVIDATPEGDGDQVVTPPAAKDP